MKVGKRLAAGDKKKARADRQSPASTSMKTKGTGSKKISQSKLPTVGRGTENAGLRNTAEEKLRKQTKKLKQQYPDDLESIIHELQVHQIELEMQNEELRSAHHQIEASRSALSDLYDFAPVGYFTFDKNGLILAVNLTGASLLGIERGNLIKKPFSQYIHKDDQDLFYHHRLKVLHKKEKSACEIRMKSRLREVFITRLESIAVKDTAGKYSWIRTAVSDVTDRWKAAEALKKSEERMKKILETTNEGFWLIDNNGVTLEINNASCSMLRTRYEDIIGKEIYDFIDKEHIATVKKQLRLRMGGKSSTYELTLMCPDGSRVFCIMNASPLFDNENKFVGSFAMITDITDIKQFQVDQERLKQRLESQWEIARMVNADKKSIYTKVLSEIVKISESRYGFYGFLNEDESVMSIHAWSKGVLKECDVHEKPLAFPVNKAGVWGNAVRERKVFIIDDYNKSHPDKKGIPEGHVHIINIMVVPILVNKRVVAVGAVANKDGKYSEKDGEQISIFLHSAQMILDKRIAEEELKEHREHLIDTVEERTAELRISNEELEQEIMQRKKIEEELKLMALFAELNPSPVIRFNKDGRVSMANPSAIEILGKSSILNSLVHSLIPGSDMIDLADCIQNGLISSISARIGSRSYQFTFKGIPELNIGQIYGSDISQLEEARADAERVNYLANIGELAAGVAHEINNPINSVINYAEMITLDTAGNGKEHEIAVRIIREGNRIAHIVKNLLSFARESKEEKKLNSMCQILSDILVLTEAQILSDGITLINDVPSDLPEIIVHARQIEQVFFNIISNARYALNRKYPEKHEDKVLTITGGMVSVNRRRYVRITFHDNGIGIPLENQDKVKRPFYTTKAGTEGTGLGLSISDRIITDHDGKLTIDSTEGEFTKVTVELPSKE